MNSISMSSSPAPVVFGPTPLTPADKKIISFNKKQDTNHHKIMNETKKMSRRYNVNQFITNLHKDKLKQLYDAFPDFESVRNRIIYPEEIQDEDETVLLKTIYQFDKQVNNKKCLHLELLKFIVYVIYEDTYISNSQLNNILLVSYNLICHEFSAPFKILTKSSKEFNLTSINKFYYFLIGESNNDIIFNEDIIIEKEEEEKDQTLYNCCCCFDNFRKWDKYIKCSCTVDICIECFSNISNKCPLCRSGNIYLIDNTNNEEDKRNIKFTRLGKTQEREIKNLRFLSENNELLLIFYDYQSNQIRDTTINIKDYEDIVNTEYDNFTDDLIYRIPNNEILSYIYEDSSNPFYNIIDGEILNFIRENQEETAGDKIKNILRIEDIDDYKKFRDGYRSFEIEREDRITKQLYRRDTSSNEDYFFMMFDDNKFEFEKYYKHAIYNQYGDPVEEKIFNIGGNLAHEGYSLNDFNINNMVDEDDSIIV